MLTWSYVVNNLHSVKQDFVEIQWFEDVYLQTTHLFLGQILGLFRQLAGTVKIAEVLVQVAQSLEMAPVSECSLSLCVRLC